MRKRGVDLNSNEAQKKISEYARFGSRLGLERMGYLMDELNHPEEKLKVIHVAGTNGKGSVCRYIYETLLSLGYKVGIFSSPYVYDFCERIEANGEMINEKELDVLTKKVLLAADKIVKEKNESPTEFEILTAIGLLYFEEKDLDFVVLEVGLGGRGDSTNIIKNPILTVITHISLDHMDQLGDTIEKIASEKAGIIKPNCPVVISARNEAAKVIAKKAYELKSPLIDSTRIKYKIHSQSIEGFSFSAIIDGKRFDNIEISMVGNHQIENAICSLCAIELLRSKKYIVTDSEPLRQGMKKAALLSRFQIFNKEPLVIFDGAHNASGAKVLADAINNLLPSKKILMVVSILKDKEDKEILREFEGIASDFIATASSNERSLSGEELASKINGNVTMAQTAKDAYEMAMKMSERYDAVIFAGSFYMISDIMNYLRGEGKC